MEYFYGNIEEATLENPYYRRVLATTSTMQLVLMTLSPQQEIGMEFHAGITQFIRIEKGRGVAIVNGKSYQLMDGVYIIIPPYTWHNIINTATTEELKLYTLYSPPEHDPAEIEPTKK